jgi:hypothetical protein
MTFQISKIEYFLKHINPILSIRDIHNIDSNILCDLGQTKQSSIDQCTNTIPPIFNIG